MAEDAKLCTAQAIVGEQLDFRIKPLSCFLPSVIFETFVAQGRGPRISECHMMPPGYWNKGHRREQSTQSEGRVDVISNVLTVGGVGEAYVTQFANRNK